MAAILVLAQSDQLAAKQTLAATFTSLQTQFNADQAAYRTLEARYLDGDPSVTRAQLRAQGEAAYQNPRYTALVQAQRQMAEDSTNVAGPTSALAGVEGQKAALVSRIAGTIDQLEAVRMAHLKEVRISEWNLRQQQLSGQRDRWANQMNATVPPSSSPPRPGTT